MHTSTCTLPSISDLFSMDNHASTTRSSSVLDISNLLSSPSATKKSFRSTSLKTKRKRASPNQLEVLNRIFNQTYFPSTEIRIELGKQLGMSPRTVQIWFQNKRQALRTKGRNSPPSDAFYHLPSLSPPRSPLSSTNQQSISLPPLRSFPSQQQQVSSFPSPNSIDQFHYRDY